MRDLRLDCMKDLWSNQKYVPSASKQSMEVKEEGRGVA